MFKILCFFIFLLCNQSPANTNFDLDNLDIEWTYFSSKQKIIQKWFKAKQIEHHLNIEDCILYPFGGGDIIYPITFFPNFKKLIIIGLEPTGAEFNLKNADELRDNLKHLFLRGFFVTRDMEKFAPCGILTIILIQLAKLGATNIEFAVSHKNDHKTIEIRCVLENETREITYIQANLNDANYEKWNEITANLPTFTLFIKSASFLLQQNGFAKIKQLLANKANVVVQDDTGFAYKDQKTLKFTTYLYGTYFAPYTIKGLEKYFQPDLKTAYEDPNIEKLPYETIGYRGTGTYGNLQILVKNH